MLFRSDGSGTLRAALSSLRQPSRAMGSRLIVAIFALTSLPIKLPVGATSPVFLPHHFLQAWIPFLQIPDCINQATFPFKIYVRKLHHKHIWRAEGCHFHQLPHSLCLTTRTQSVGKYR